MLLHLGIYWTSWHGVIKLQSRPLLMLAAVLLLSRLWTTTTNQVYAQKMMVSVVRSFHFYWNPYHDA
jgi:hypothetical protein